MRPLLSTLAILLLTLATHAAEQEKFLLDMGNKGSSETGSPIPPPSPARLADWGYTGRVAGSIGGIQTFDALAPGLIPEGSPEREWAAKRAADLRSVVAESHAAGLKCYAGTDVFILPKALAAKFHDEICDKEGRIDILLPKTQEIFRALLQESFALAPDLDGIIVRTGEVYLHDYPYHTADGKGGGGGKKIQGNTAIIHGVESHIALLRILREEICVRLGKQLIYRTWDFGWLHEKPDYYLKVTDAIEPHPLLVFSIKHQQGDFHQLTPFNPTLMIGKHPQIIEVQAQREAYGKGAHPYYIGQGVIEGWEEYAWIMKPGQPKGLRDVIKNPLCAGVWTWSRGGGWDGPTITNGLWCDLNTYVIAKFAENPARSEEEIFNEFAAKLGLSPSDIARFRELNLLSAKAVLRGQLTCLGGKIDVWWARDDTLKDPDLRDFVAKDLVEKAIAEKAEAVRMWRRIEELAQQINFPDAATNDFVRTSATYGRIKYDIIAQGWTVILLGLDGDKKKTYDRPRIEAAAAAYDQLWRDWNALKDTRPACSTIYKDIGLGQAVARHRQPPDKQIP